VKLQGTSSSVSCCRLRIYKNRVLRRVFGPEVEKVRTEGQKKLQSDGHHNFHPLPNIIRGGKIKEDEMGGTCNTPEEKICLEILGIDWG